jgi:DNA replication initiation complex subunit (GINS family)
MSLYDELYAAWRREIGSAALSGLPHDFYVRIADYLRRLSEESRMMDKKTMKAALLEHEEEHVRRMVEELVRTRYSKLVKLVNESGKVPDDLLAAEEAQVFEGFVPFAAAYQRFAKGLFQGQITRAEVETPHKRVTLRFVKPVPAIIGGDMKAYGPFMVEDVASVPIENAKLLVKQGLAVLVEVS